jgi:hypothetical protein
MTDRKAVGVQKKTRILELSIMKQRANRHTANFRTFRKQKIGSGRWKASVPHFGFKFWILRLQHIKK